MRGNNLSYDMGLEVGFGFRSDLPWMWTASLLPAYLSQSAGL